MQREKLYICYATSDSFCPHTGISLMSLLVNNRNLSIEKVFILDYGIESVNFQKLNYLAHKFGVAMEFIDAGIILESLRSELKLQDFRNSLATYSRAFIDYIMPSYVKRLLYIDSDTIVLSGLEAILDIEIEDYAMGCVIDIERYFNKKIRDTELKLLSGNHCYYGCGVVLYNLEMWRQSQARDYISATCRENIPLKFADQTLINNALPEKFIRAIPLKFNYPGHAFNRGWEKWQLMRGGWYAEETIIEAMNNPVIIHYKGSPLNRPWYDECLSQRKNDYLKMKELSPWRDEPLMSMKKYYDNLSNNRQKIMFKFTVADMKTPKRWMRTYLRLLRRICLAIGGC